MVGARVKDYYASQAKDRQKLSEGRGQKGPANLPDLKGDARDLAGKAVGVSGKSIDYCDLSAMLYCGLSAMTIF